MKNNKINIINKIATLAVIVSTAFVPLSSFAKDNGNGNKANKVSTVNAGVVENVPVGPCSAFGHYTAPGWIKHNGAMKPPEGCVLPPGIAKKLNNNVGTTTPPADTTAPIISSLSTSIGTTTVDVSWVTNEPATSKIYYSTTSPVVKTATSTLVMENAFLVTNRMLHISGLNPNTVYYLIIESKDASGNTATLATSLMTHALPTVDTTAPVISNIVSNVGVSTSTISWNTDEFATSKVYFATTSALDINSSTTASIGNLALMTGHSLSLSGLMASTTYYVVIESKDAFNNTATSGVRSFTTNVAPDVTAPVISTLSSSVGSTTLTVGWNTDELATSKIFYSKISPLNKTATTTLFVENLALTTSHAMTITGLSTSTPYFFTLESKDSSNNIATSSEFTTTTGF